MTSEPQQDRKLSEIGHLFLSSIREKASNGAPAPRRMPPGQRREPSIDLTPEELAQVLGEDHDDHQQNVHVPEITAVIASHLSGKQRDRAREYARHLSADGSRIGVIEVDASEFRLTCFDPSAGESAPEPPTVETFDPRQITDALYEMSADVDRWLLLLTTPRAPEARGILRDVQRWTTLCVADHDGVIACYRALKGLSDLWSLDAVKPRLSLALLDTVDEEHGQRVHAKLAAVCQQFLAWRVESEPLVRPVLETAEHVVLSCRPMHEKTQVAAAPQWQILGELLMRSKQCAANEPTPQQKQWAQQLIPSEPPARQEPHQPALSIALATEPHESVVIDIPEDASETSILSAVLHSRSGELVECPLTPPTTPTARLAVGRDRRIVLLAVARQGLSQLTQISQAYRWLVENRALIAMAMPQLSIDPTQPPQLSLFIDQSDTSANTLRPILQSAQVTVQTYRMLRWSGKRGLLLEAA